MLASVYRIRDRGIRLPKPKDPVTGDLRFEDEKHADAEMQVARLMGTGSTENLPTLFKAKVKRVTANGMIIQGTEFITRGQQKSKSYPVPQTWWAFIHTDSGLSRYDGNDPLDTIADLKVSGGF